MNQTSELKGSKALQSKTKLKVSACVKRLCTSQTTIRSTPETKPTPSAKGHDFTMENTLKQFPEKIEFPEMRSIFHKLDFMKQYIVNNKDQEDVFVMKIWKKLTKENQHVTREKLTNYLRSIKKSHHSTMSDGFYEKNSSGSYDVSRFNSLHDIQLNDDEDSKISKGKSVARFSSSYDNGIHTFHKSHESMQIIPKNFEDFKETYLTTDFLNSKKTYFL